jgi:hypothetical protein
VERPDPGNYHAAPGFNAWIDDTYEGTNGPLEIHGLELQPSEVLHQLGYSQYAAVHADYLERKASEVKDLVYFEYPRPIAYAFFRSVRGAASSLERLHFLRDTWEAVIDILHAVVVSECRHLQIDLGEALRVADRPGKLKSLLTNQVFGKLQNIEKILDWCAANEIELESARLLADKELIEQMRELNRTRNGFSHRSTLSEAQAEAIVERASDEVYDLLEQLGGLSELELVRYVSQVGPVAKFDRFRGHAMTRDFLDLDIAPGRYPGCEECLDDKRVSVLCGQRLFTLTPLVHWNTSNEGHATDLLAFRQTRGEGDACTLEFSQLSTGDPLALPRADFEAAIDELKALFCDRAEPGS